MNEYLVLLLGVIFAAAGGELFVRGTVGLARISPGIIGATVAAFATSSPEFSVSITSALAEKTKIALGTDAAMALITAMPEASIRPWVRIKVTILKALWNHASYIISLLISCGTLSV